MGNKKEFLKELTELSKKYDLYIGGCGCCGSPYIYSELLEFKYEGNDLDFDDELLEYTIKETTANLLGDKEEEN